MSEFKLKLEKFKKGAIIYVEGSKNVDNFYILKSGQVKISRNIEITDDPSQIYLKEGDYFGVISCMGKRPRLETATAMTNLLLISVQYEQFEELIRRNNKVALKIIKLYSKRLRIFDDAITRITLKKPVPSDPEELFNIGLYYNKKQEFKQARYAFTKFTKYCPNSPNTPTAYKYLEELNQKLEDVKEYIQDTPLLRNYFDKSILFCEHEPGDDVFIIQEGKIKITKVVGDNEVLLAVLNPGDILGEMALIENRPRSATAIAFGDAKTLVINKQNFMVMVQNRPQIVMKIIYLLSERIWVAYRQIENTAIPDKFGRLADILLTQIEKKRAEIGQRKPYQFDFGIDELLTMAGMDKESGYEYARKLLEDPNFKLEDGKIVVVDTAGLYNMVESFRKKINKESIT